MKLISFTGVAGSGKSTAAECIKQLQHNPVVLKKLAEALYDIQEFIYTRIGMPVPEPKDRFLLQFIGTDWGRARMGDTLWIDLWQKNILDAEAAFNNLPSEPIFITDDVRYDNEAEAVKFLGGHVIKIVSTFAESRNTSKSGIANHISENGVDLRHVDFIIENNGSIEDLKQSLMTLNDRVHLW